MKTLDGFEKQISELQRQVAISEANYRLYLTKFEEAKISESMDKQKIANVRIIEPAVPIMRPVKPKKRLNVMIGGFLGLFAGVGLAFLIEFIHPVFRTREDVDQFLGLRVLATLPKD
ncbi:MAG: lipopolysaccharide biosynthesis protein, partial [Deltaproteobacteria bacterium]|nr:lipopolysaccharide biosynthesis protein [Deltaproteobacteria bacterium]